MKFLAKLGSISGLVVAGLLLYATSAHAATFTVTSIADDPAVAPAVGCATALPACTLRSSIEAANAQAGADIIEFNIAGAGVHTISPASEYEQITEQVTIDGSTQSGASCGTLVPTSLPANSNTPHTLLIEIDGSLAGIGGGFDLSSGSDNSIVRGLAMNNSQDRPEIQVNANTVTVECNYLGTNAGGTAAGASNTSAGITVSGDGNIVQNNLISGNIDNGASVTGQSIESSLSSNLIGTTANGLTALPNSGTGVVLNGLASMEHNIVSASEGDGVMMLGNGNSVNGSFIGLSLNGSPLGNDGAGINTDRDTSGYAIGDSGGEVNVISANGGNGISIFSRSGDSCPSNVVSEIFGNKIGTTTNGEVQSSYGNGGSGIAAWEIDGSNCVASVYKHKIGGANAGEPNIIAGNSQDGVRVYEYVDPNDADNHTDVFSIAIVQNSIFGNGNLGINLASASDPFDGIANVDVGPNALNSFPIDYPASRANNYLNHPTINSVAISGSNATVNYTFQAPSVLENPNALLASNLVGFRLDFYINSGSQDGAYAGYSQGKTHLGSFMVDGSETNATHTFTSPVPLSSNQNITTTATILWQIEECPGQQGNGPPYSSNCE